MPVRLPQQGWRKPFACATHPQPARLKALSSGQGSATDRGRAAWCCHSWILLWAHHVAGSARPVVTVVALKAPVVAQDAATAPFEADLIR